MFVLPSTQNYNFSATGQLANGLNKIDTEKLALYTANQNRMTIDQNGNIGVNTTSPQERFHINGSLRVNDNITLGGNLNVLGTTFTVNADTLVVSDPMIRLADNNPDNLMDFGLYGMYVDTGVTKFGGLIKDSTENKWHLFDNDTTEPGVTQHTISNSLLTIESDTGYVGIGITNPNYALDIYSPDAILVPKGTSGERPSSVTNGLFRYNTTLTQFEGYSNGSWAPIGGGASDLDGDTYIQAETSVGADNDQLQFFTAGTERIRIQSGGFVGIGTTEPSHKLHIEHSSGLLGLFETTDTGAAAFVKLKSNRTNTGNLGIIDFDSDSATISRIITKVSDHTNDYGNLAFWTKGSDGSNERMRIDETGNIGIGTGTPQNRLHLYSSTGLEDIFISFNDSTLGSSATNGFVIGKQTAAGYIWNYETANLIFGTDNTQRMTIFGTSGYVGIGTSTSLAARLHLYDSSDNILQIQRSDSNASLIRFENSTSANVYLGMDANENLVLDQRSGSNDIVMNTNSTERMRILSGGNVGIGTLEPNDKLEVNEGMITTKSGYFTAYPIYSETWPTNTTAGDMGTWVVVSGTVGFNGDSQTAGIVGFDGNNWIEMRSTANYETPVLTNLETSWVPYTDGAYSVDEKYTTNRILVKFMALESSFDNANEYWSLEITNDNGSNWYAVTKNTSDDTTAGTDSRGWHPVTADISSFIVDGGTHKLRFRLEPTGTGDLLYVSRFSIVVDDSNPWYLTSAYNANFMGNVGIGTYNPNASLDVLSTTWPQATIRTSDSGIAGLWVQNSTTGYASTNGFEFALGASEETYIWNYSNTHLAIGTNATERIRILADGSVGIGSTAASGNGKRLRLYHNANESNSLGIHNPNSGASADATIALDSNGCTAILRATSTGKTGTGADEDDQVSLYANNASNGLAIGTSTDDIQFYTGGKATTNERMRINSSGNVGIGTTNPGSILDIQQGVNDDVELRVEETIGGTIARTLISAVAPGGTTSLVTTTGSYTTAGIYEANASYLVSDLTQGMKIACTNAASTADMIFLTNSTERMAILQNGNVSIGTAANANHGTRNLQIHASDSSGSWATFSNSTTTAAASSGFLLGLNASEEVQIHNYENTDMRFATNSIDRMRITSDGNIGIGTSTVDNQFHIFNTSHARMKVETSGTNQAGTIYQSSAANWIIGQHGGESARFKISNSTAFGTNDRFTMTTDGIVGIGTDIPAAIAGGLHCYGTGGDLLALTSTNTTGRSTIKFYTNGNDWELGARGSSGSPDNSFYLYDTASSKYRMVVDSKGQVGIGDTTIGQSRLNVEDGYYSNTVIYRETFPTANTTGDIGTWVVTGNVTWNGIFSQLDGENFIDLTDGAEMTSPTLTDLETVWKMYSDDAFVDNEALNSTRVVLKCMVQYFSHDSASEECNIMVTNDNGSNWHLVWKSVNDNQSSDTRGWHPVCADLTPFLVNGGTHKIRFQHEGAGTADYFGISHIAICLDDTTPFYKFGAYHGIFMGQVGIGTYNALTLLDINENSTTTPALLIRNGNSSINFNNGAQIALGYQGSNNYQHFIHTRHNASNSNNAIDFYVCNGTSSNTVTSGSIHTMSLVSGNVGIGTTNPADKLHIRDDDATGTKIMLSNYNATNDNYREIRFTGYRDVNQVHPAAAVRAIQTDSDTGLSKNSHLTFWTENGSGGNYGIEGTTFAERMRILSGGNVGIGTASPNEKLHVHGDIRFGTANKMVLDDSSWQNAGNFEITSGSGTFGFHGTGGNTLGVTIDGALSKTSGSFDIPHPDPEKEKNRYRLQHCFVEAPTAGDNMYRFECEASYDGETVIVELPEYYKHLNHNTDIWINGIKHFGRAYGEIAEDEEHLLITCEKAGKYKVLCIGTRKDSFAVKHFKGPEYQQTEEEYFKYVNRGLKKKFIPKGEDDQPNREDQDMSDIVIEDTE